MKNELKKFFLDAKIEYFTVISYSDCTEINKRIIDREQFEAKSAIVYILPYYSGQTENLSLYAASIDYHLAIREINAGLVKLLKEKFPEAGVKGYGDHSPINERHAALIGGLGIQGENGLLINEKYGSFIFIADVITDIDPEALGAVSPKKIESCIGCGACKRACPTGILRGEGEDCLSAITQRKGELTDYEIDLMQRNNTLWGCDICQTACPYNREPILTPVEFFHKDRIPRLTKEILDNMSDDEFNNRAFAWRKRNTVRRNIEILEQKSK